MNISTEVNKYFGEEMARNVVATISDEELKTIAEKAWRGLTTSSGYFSDIAPIDGLVKAEYLARLKEQFVVISSSEVFQEKLKADTPKLLDDILEATKKKMVEEISDRLSMLSTGQHGFGINTLMDDFVSSAANQIRNR